VQQRERLAIAVRFREGIRMLKAGWLVTVVVSLPLAYLPTAAAQPAATQPAPQLISTSQVFRYPLTDPYDLKNLYGFNHAPSIVRLPDGRLLTTWFSGPFEASVHQLILASCSADGGVTWSAAEVIQDTPRTSDFDPAHIVDGARTWLFFTAGRWNRYPSAGPRQNELVGIQSYKLFARHSDDSGATWSQPQQIMDRPGYGCRSNGIRLSGGDLLLPVYSFEPPYSSGVLKSTDRGTSWRHYEKVATPGKVGAGEPTIVELRSGDVLMAVRTTDGHLWTARSRDKGETWSEPQRSAMAANTSSHNLFRLADGRIALTHGPCEPSKRTLLTLRVSADDGATWGEPLALAEVEPATAGESTWDREVTYPSVAQQKDGTLVVVWTWIQSSQESQWGVIQSARVRVP
jgi:predicted neuraminidase